MKPSPCGALVVDKPAGMTSHDVVGRVRRALATRQVGHAGTLDPMATGVLLVLVGEATKLASYATAADKTYLTTIALGRDTSTYDSEGETTRERPVPIALVNELDDLEEARQIGRVAEALANEARRDLQVPPVISAIHVEGKRAHERARAGEIVEMEPRRVAVGSIEWLSGRGDPPELTVRLSVSKGYYVRSLARDLGEALGTGAHLSMLRRVASGSFTIDEAVPLDRVAPEQLIDLRTLGARTIGTVSLASSGVERARVGKALGPDDFAGATRDEAALWIDEQGAAIAIGARAVDGAYRVLRGIAAG